MTIRCLSSLYFHSSLRSILSRLPEAEDKQKAATEAADTATKIAEKIAATAAAAGSRR